MKGESSLFEESGEGGKYKSWLYIPQEYLTPTLNLPPSTRTSATHYVRYETWLQPHPYLLRWEIVRAR